MKLKFIIIFLFTTSLLVAQNSIKLCDNESIIFNYAQNSIMFQIGKEKVSFENNLTAHGELSLSVECITNGFNMIITAQNGNEYEIHYFIFQKKANDYFLENYYTKNTNRNNETLKGFLTNQISFKNFKAIPDANKSLISISLKDGFQSVEKEHIDYYKQINLFFRNKKCQNIKLFTNEFVLNSLHIFDKLNAEELNNLGYYALEAGAFSNAKFILLEVIKKYPNRVNAYLNLADTYYALKNEAIAKKYYSEYIAKMIELKKDFNKVPKRAIIRSK